jgi:hypothetical protein
MQRRDLADAEIRFDGCGHEYRFFSKNGHINLTQFGNQLSITHISFDASGTILKAAQN